MPRIVYTPGYGSMDFSVRPITLGGTGASDETQAAANLRLLTYDSLDEPNGPVSVDNHKLIDINRIPAMIIGTDTSYIAEEHQFTISNYDATVNYSIAPLAGEGYVEGTVLCVGDTITYTAPATPGASGFVINGKVINVTVLPPSVLKPSITYPTDGSTISAVSITFTSTDFAITGGTDVHSSSTWQVASDITFTTIVDETVNNTVDLTAWTPTNLPANTTLYVRVKYTGVVSGDSDWSDTITITTIGGYTNKSEIQILSASDSSDSTQFGISTANDISISNDGNIAIIGASYATSGGYTNAGQAYVFTRSGNVWTQQQILSASDVSDYADFGYSVAISGDGYTAVIGARIANSSGYSRAGQAYIFTRSGDVWTQQQILSASDASANAYFGYSVAISNDGGIVLVSAPYAASGGFSSAGQIYAFTRSGNTWTQQQILAASDPSNNASIGTSIALNGTGDVALISSINSTFIYAGAGVVYAFTRSGNTWTQQQKFGAGSPSYGAYFGYSISISNDGNTAAIGAPISTGSGYDGAGRAFVYKRYNGVWSMDYALDASDANYSVNYGTSVSISGDGSTVLVGGPFATSGGHSSAGQAYVYTQSNYDWIEQQILSASNSGVNSYFGYNTGISYNGSMMFVALTEANNDVYYIPGHVYVFG